MAAAAAAAFGESVGESKKPVSVFGEMKENALGLPPFVGATGKPYTNYKQDSENWDLGKVALRAVVAKKESKEKKAEEGETGAAAAQPKIPKKPKKQQYTVMYGDKPLRVQFNWLKINHVDHHGDFFSVLSPMKSAAEMPEGFDHLMEGNLQTALAAVRDRVIDDLRAQGHTKAFTKFLEPSKDARFPPTLALSYHKSASIVRVKAASVHVYGDTMKGTVEKNVSKGALHAPIARLQISEPEENGMVWFNFIVDMAAVLAKPELLVRSDEREQAWLEAARAHLSSEEFRKAFPVHASRGPVQGGKKRAAPKKAEVVAPAGEEGAAAEAAPAAAKKKRKTKKEREQEQAELQARLEAQPDYVAEAEAEQL